MIDDGYLGGSNQPSEPVTDRGFTDHEHLDDFELIHMNGRAYDYNLGRFLSVDPVIQAPGNSQSMNPYSYIMNNPLAGTDPSGYISIGVTDSLWDKWNARFDVLAGFTTASWNNGKRSGQVLESKAESIYRRSIISEIESQGKTATVQRYKAPEEEAQWSLWPASIAGMILPIPIPAILQVIPCIACMPTYEDTKKHWQKGSGKDIQVLTSEIDFSKLDLSQAPQIKKTIIRNSNAKIGDVFKIEWNNKNDNLAYETLDEQYEVLGDISLKVTGYLIRMDDSWYFNGQYKPFDDYYNFDFQLSKPIRSLLTIGAKIDHGKGKPFWIEFLGDIKFRGYIK